LRKLAEPSKPSANQAGQPSSVAPGSQTATASEGSAAATGGGIANVGSGNINVVGGVQGGITIVHGGTPPAEPIPAPQSGYDLQAVRELLSAAFSDEEIVTLAFDRFRAVYEDISGAMSKGDKIRRLVDWCDKQVRMDSLLAEVKRRNPKQYARYAARLKMQ
jgi:hypothetical protein